MKKAVRLTLLVGWVTVTTVTVTRLWFTYPDAFPRFPDAFWISLISVFGSTNGEDLANLELIVVFTMSLCVTLALTFLILATERHIRNNRRRQRA